MWAQVTAPVEKMKQIGVSAIQAKAIQRQIIMVEPTGNSLKIIRGTAKGIALPMQFFRVIGKKK